MLLAIVICNLTIRLKVTHTKMFDIENKLSSSTFAFYFNQNFVLPRMIHKKDIP